MTHQGRSNGLNALFGPESVAVVGASIDRVRIGGRPLWNLERFGFQGRVYPVNPKYTSIRALDCYPSVAALPEVPDLVVITVGGDHVVPILQECAQLGVGAAIVFASGFSELGAEGSDRQETVANIAAESGMRILGPNTLGLRNHTNGLFATFATDLDSGATAGTSAIVAQSGGLGGYVGVALPREIGAGTRYFIDTGNEADVEVAECVEHLADDPEVSIIALLIEGCKDGRRLIRACARARAAGKLVAAMKVGTSIRGAAAARSHTGALAGEDRAWSAALRAAGVVRVEDEMVMASLIALADVAPPQGRRLGLLTLSGGVAVSMLDGCERLGLEIPPLAPAASGPTSVTVSGTNPIDASGGVANDPEALGDLLTHIAGDGAVDAVVIFLAYMLLSPTLAPAIVRGLVSVADRSTKPIYVCGLAGPEVREALLAAKVLVFASPSTFLRAYASAAIPPQQETGSHFEPPVDAVGPPGETVLTGALARARLPDIPFPPSVEVSGSHDAADAVAQFGWPMVLKAEPDGVPHKTELGLVRTDLHDLPSLLRALDDIREALDQNKLNASVVAGPQIDGVEAIVGFNNDPTFGPMIAVGLGGIFVEQLDDLEMLLAPATSTEIRNALERLSHRELLLAPRGQPPPDIDGLTNAVAKFSRWCVEQSGLDSVDLNPVIVGNMETGVVAVDAVVVVREEA